MKKKIKKNAKKQPVKIQQNFVVVLRADSELLACGLWFDDQKEAELIAKEAIVSHKAVWCARRSINVPVDSAYVCRVVSETSISAQLAKRK